MANTVTTATIEILSLAAVSRHGLQAQAARHLTVVLGKSFLHFRSPAGLAVTSKLDLSLMTVFNSSDSTTVVKGLVGESNSADNLTLSRNPLFDVEHVGSPLILVLARARRGADRAT